MKEMAMLLTIVCTTMRTGKNIESAIHLHQENKKLVSFYFFEGAAVRHISMYPMMAFFPPLRLLGYNGDV